MTSPLFIGMQPFVSGYGEDDEVVYIPITCIPFTSAYAPLSPLDCLTVPINQPFCVAV